MTRFCVLFKANSNEICERIIFVHLERKLMSAFFLSHLNHPRNHFKALIICLIHVSQLFVLPVLTDSCWCMFSHVRSQLFGKMCGYSQFSFWIPTALSKIFFFYLHVVLLWAIDLCF